jgi:hypothetical protein
LAEKWVDGYSESLPIIRAEKELRLFTLLCHVLPPHTDQEVKIRKEFIARLEQEMAGESGQTTSRKGMSVHDAAAQLGTAGMLSEIIEGPAFEHGIGQHKKKPD